jgi:flagellar basal-body rod modification protein FlgD
MAISSVLQSTSSAPGQTASSSASLNMTTFMKLLTTQLANQDPLDPMSDSDFFAQLAQMGTVQGVQQIQQTMQVAQAAALMGKTVSGVAVDSSSGVSSLVSGTVSSVSVQNGNYMLNLVDSSGNMSSVSINNVTSITGGSSQSGS